MHKSCTATIIAEKLFCCYKGKKYFSNNKICEKGEIFIHFSYEIAVKLKNLSVYIHRKRRCMLQPNESLRNPKWNKKYGDNVVLQVCSRIIIRIGREGAKIIQSRRQT